MNSHPFNNDNSDEKKNKLKRIENDYKKRLEFLE